MDDHSTVLRLRISKADLEKVKEAAKADHLTLSAYVRREILKAIEAGK